MQKLHTYLSPSKVLFGVGSAGSVGAQTRKWGAKKAVIITDEGVLKANLADTVKASLTSEGLEVGVFDKVKSDPPSQVIDEATEFVRKNGYQLIIGLGGGSSLDVAKAASVMAVNEGSILDFSGVDLVPKKGLPQILIPTTAGTGSEVTRVVVVTDERDNTKKVVFSDFILPDIAIVDPALTLSMPPTVTVDTGIDALVHGIEAYVSINATPFSDILAIEAIRLIGENFLVTYAKGTNIESRSNMALAATLAGMAFTSAGLGAIHALGYPLDTEFGLSHGRSMALVLPYVLDYNKIGNLTKYAFIARAIKVNIEGLCMFKAAEELVIYTKRLLEILNVSTKLSDYGISKNDVPRLVAGAMKHARLFGPNPRDLTEKDVTNIYMSAF